MKTHAVRHLDWLVIIAIAAAVAMWPLLLPSASGFAVSSAPSPRANALLAVLATIAGVGFGMAVAYYRAVFDVHQRQLMMPTAPLSEYLSSGLGPLPPEARASDLYLDMVKRTVTNVIYQDEPERFYHRGRTLRAEGFDLHRRAEGLDYPTKAHTMIGIRRLDNLQKCIETTLRENIAGDILESGVLCGGASIFARAVLKAHGNTDRRVYACDTYVPRSVSPPVCLILLGYPLLRCAASIPSRWWKRKLREYDRRSRADVSPLVARRILHRRRLLHS